jgi:hypothetical protein
MESNSFNLNDYLEDNHFTIDSENYYKDVFEELDSLRNNDARRLSFSIPEDAKKLQSALVSPSAPPPTPEISPFTPRLTLQIPEENDDCIFSLDGFVDEIESNPPSPKQFKNSIEFPIEFLLTFPDTDKTLYKIPPRKAQDARKIWRYAKISKTAQIRQIELKLLDWAFTYANLKIFDNKIQAIIWKTHSGCLCSSKWSTFVKWIICASLAV